MAVNTPENPVRFPYFHTSVPEHKADLDDQAKNPLIPREPYGEKVVAKRAVVFARGRTPDLLEQLPESYKQSGKDLIAALGNPNHPNRRDAEQAMRRYSTSVERRAAEKPKGMTLNSAAQEFNVPRNFLWRWSKQRRAIPIIEEGTGIGSPTYLDRERTREVAEIYHEAKRQGKQPKTLLEAKFPGISKIPPK